MGLWACLAVLFAASPACAQLFNYFNVVQGQRAFGLGGAYTAISDDPSGWYYNPAGVANAERDQLNFTARAVESSAISISEYAGDRELILGSLTFYPTGGGVLKQLGPGKIGFATLVVSNEDIDTDETLEHASWNGEQARVNVALRQSQRTYLFGPGYSIHPSEHLSLGLTLFYFYDQKRAGRFTYVDFGDGGYRDEAFDLKSTNHGLVPHLGALYQIYEWWSVGVTLRQGFALYRSGFTKWITHVDHGGVQGRIQTTRNFKAETAFPFTVVVGSAIKPRDWITLSLDVSYFAPQHLLTITTGEERENQTEMKQVWNYNAGMEFLIRERWPLSCGMYTNRSAAPDPYELADTGILKVHWIGFTLQGGYRSEHTLTSVGLLLNLGNGDTINLDGEKTDVNGGSASLIFATSYWFE